MGIGTELAGHVQASHLRNWLADLFHAAGLREGPTTCVVDNLVLAELRGVRSHGLLLAPVYVNRILSGGIRKDAEPTVIFDSDAVAIVDGSAGPGQYAACFATGLAIDKAKRSGVSFVNTINNNHIGHLASYGLDLTRAGCAGIVMTNAGPALAAFSGRTPALGNNAVCFAFPSESDPLIVDMAVGAAACGKVRVAALDGRQLTEPWLIDSQGAPTLDPSALDSGAMLPAGGHKGYALAVAIDALTGALAGGTLSPHVLKQRVELSQCQGVCQTVVAFHPAFWGAQGSITSTVGQFLRFLRALTPSAAAAEVLAPGDPELLQQTRNGELGIRVPYELLQELNDVARLVGAAPLH